MSHIGFPGVPRAGVAPTSGDTADDTAPAAPTGVTAVGSTEENTITWAANDEPDLDGYNLYGSSTQTGGYAQLNLSLWPTDRPRSWRHADAPEGVPTYYRVTAVDKSGNESPMSAFAVSTRQATSALPLMGTYSSKRIHESYGVCAHPGFNTSVYRPANQDAWYTRMVDGLGIRVQRSGYGNVANNAGAKAAVLQARDRGVRMLMIAVDENAGTPADAVATVNWIAAYAWDVCLGIEGINEPNHDRGDNTVPAGWVQRAYDIQKAISQAMRDTTVRTVPGAIGGDTFTNAERLSGALRVGPSLHDTFGARNNGAHYKELAAYRRSVGDGIANYQDYLGVHRYAGGGVPTNNLDQRLGLIRGTEAFGAGYPVWLTECGYHNALETPLGHHPVPEDVQAAYEPRMILEYCAEYGLRAMSYELLDDADPGPNQLDTQESHFGAYAVTDHADSFNPAKWRPKAQVATIGALMQDLYDPGSDYTPQPVRFQVHTDDPSIKVFPTQKRDGQTTLRLYRAVQLWNPLERTYRTAAEVGPDTTVTVVDSVGSRQVTVGPAVTSLVLR